MKLIVYGKDREIFESNKVSVPDSIIELYQYCGGRMGKELFERIIDGLVNTGTIKDMVDVFDNMSCEHYRNSHKTKGMNQYGLCT